MTQLDTFETALLSELRHHVEERDSRPARSRTRLVVSGLGVAAAAVTAAVVIPGTRRHHGVLGPGGQRR